MTLFVGATIAAAAIAAHQKTYGALLFVPFIVEFFLKAQGRFKGESYGSLGADGRLVHEGRIESLSHLLMRWRRLKEWQVVAGLWIIEAAVSVGVILAVVAGL